MLIVAGKHRADVEKKIFDTMNGIESSAVYNYSLTMTQNADGSWEGRAKMEFHCKQTRNCLSKKNRGTQQQTHIPLSARPSHEQAQCTVTGCDGKGNNRGLCSKHYSKYMAMSMNAGWDEPVDGISAECGDDE